MPDLNLKNITKNYGGAIAVRDISLEIRDGEFFVLAGPSGSGKSVLLRLIAGIEKLSGGELFIGGVNADGMSARDRDMAMVTEDGGLFTHRTVFDNMAYGLKLRGVPADEIRARVTAEAEEMGIGEQLQSKVRHLSALQKKYVALGRAAVRRPKVLLLDEPLAGLNDRDRLQLRADIVRLVNRLGITTVYAAGNQTEAMFTGTRVAVMKDGVLQQADTPDALVNKPNNLFTASYFGIPAINMIKAVLHEEDGGLTADFGGNTVPLPAFSAAGDYIGREVVLVIRPGDIRIEPGEAGFIATVEAAERVGFEMRLYLKADGKNDCIIACIPGGKKLEQGAKVRIGFDSGRILVFDSATGKSV